MSAKDIYHDVCVRALQKDGWTITNDPLVFKVANTDVLIDLGAERIVAAERDSERMTVEIKSFLSKSAVQDLKEAAGQFMLYELVVSVGWQGIRRVQHSLLHLDIINGKVWVQRDGTEDGIVDELEAAGIPKRDIVLAFHPEKDRALIPEYAVA